MRPGRLTPEDKKEILEAYFTETSTSLAKKYNVSRGMITKLWYDAGLRGKESRTYKFEHQDFFSNIDSEGKAYFLGFFAADGCLYCPKGNKQYIIKFTLAKEDREILEKFKICLNTNKPIFQLTINNRDYVTLELSSNKMGQDLMNLGLLPRKTYIKTWVQLSSPQLQAAFIRGYFDGDGSISTKIELNKLYKVNVNISGFEKNLSYFQEYLRTQNISSSFIRDQRKDKYTTDDPFGSLCFSNKKEKFKFLNLIYPEGCNFYLTRKFILAQKYKECFKENSISWECSRKIEQNRGKSS